MDKRSIASEGFIAQLNYTTLGYNNTGTTYAARFEAKKTADGKYIPAVSAKNTSNEENLKSVMENMKNVPKKPVF